MNKEEKILVEKKLIDLTREFCEQYLDDEYAGICEKLIKKLGRKRDVPFLTGKIEIWAAAVIHAIGFINFLFDKSSDPFITLQTLNEHFGTKPGTVSARAVK